MTPLAFVVSIPVRVYRILGSPFFGQSCRFLPTCSDYAMQALERHGAVKGSWLAITRIARCRPGGGSGFDPVPE